MVGTGRPAFSTPSRTESQVFHPELVSSFICSPANMATFGVMDRLRVTSPSYSRGIEPMLLESSNATSRVVVCAVHRRRAVLGGRARTGASALSSISSYSAWGSESSTMAPPAPMVNS